MSADYWRLIQSQPQPGAWNMALDEALLESMGSPGARPVLRLYAWVPPCLSLGFTQPAKDVDPSALAIRGWGLVRRPTGGRAILHTDELTYAVLAPITEPRVAGSVIESYRRLSSALVLGLEKMGLEVNADKEYNLPPGSSPKGPVCFEVPSNYEITAFGKKLIGSAQARKKEGVLQHGSLPLAGDLGRIIQVLKFSDETTQKLALDRLNQRATTLENVIGKAIPWDKAARSIADGFRQAFQIELVEDELSSQEIARAEQLVNEKYGKKEWTERY